MRKRRKDGVILKVADVIVLIITLLCAAALVMSYFAPYTNPNTSWVFAFFGLIAPGLYFANLALSLYWMFRWKLLFVIPAAVLLIGIGNVSTFYRLPLSKKYGEEQGKVAGAIKLVSFNVEGFVEILHDGESVSTMDSIAGYIKNMNPDVICFQEFQATLKNPKSRIDSILSDWKYEVVENFLANNRNAMFGIAVYSKYPIISNGTIRFEQSNNGVMYVELLVGKRDTLRVINNHLQTTNIDRSSMAFFDYDTFSATEDKKAQAINIVRRLRNGYRLRANQADTIAELIASKNIPTVVCGDFNDTPVSYTYKTIRGEYMDSFEEVGSGYHFTYKKLFGMLRIDYILHSPNLETVYYASPAVKWSDHNPVTATLKRK